MSIEFSQPATESADRVHHAEAAARNAEVATAAALILRDALSSAKPLDRLLVRASAGAGKSFVLKRLVEDAVAQQGCARVAVIAFTNNQIFQLAASIGKALGAEQVCLFVSAGKVGSVPEDARSNATIATSTRDIPDQVKVVV